jgi:L-iditol 2-dehydrogenase
MRAAVLSAPGELTVEERPRPEPGPDEVLVAIEAVGICGSDVHYYEHGRIGDYVVEEPLILGHESAGVVEAVEDAVTDLQPGTRVALEPGVPCRTCEHCKAGDYHLCPDVTFMATPPDDGAFAEYVAWPADFAYELPESVSTTAGALCEPLSVGLHAARRAEIEPGDSVLVTGAGPIGLLAMDAAKIRGASTVLVSDVVPEKLDRARGRGADRTIDVREDSLPGVVADATDGRGVNVVIEASGAGPAIAHTTDAVRRGGTVVQIGLPQESEHPLDVHALVDKELDIRGSFRYANTYPAAIDLLADDAIDLEGLVDFEASLDEIDDAFQRAQEEDVVKGMVRI